MILPRGHEGINHFNIWDRRNNQAKTKLTNRGQVSVECILTFHKILVGSAFILSSYSSLSLKAASDGDILSCCLGL